MNTHVTHTLTNDEEITISVDVPNVGHVSLAGEIWKGIAKGVLRAFNAAERQMSPSALVDQVKLAITRASQRGLEPEQPELRQRRMASSVMHQVADLVQAGSLDSARCVWLGGNRMLVDFATRHGVNSTVDVELGTEQKDRQWRSK